MTYTFYANKSYFDVFAMTYEAACRAFKAMTSQSTLDAALVVSVKAA